LSFLSVQGVTPHSGIVAAASQIVEQLDARSATISHLTAAQATLKGALAASEAAVSRAQSEISELKRQLLRQQTDAYSQHQTQAPLAAALQTAEAEVAALRSELSSSASALAAARDELSVARQRVADAESREEGVAAAIESERAQAAAIATALRQDASAALRSTASQAAIDKAAAVAEEVSRARAHELSARRWALRALLSRRSSADARALAAARALISWLRTLLSEMRRGEDEYSNIIVDLEVRTLAQRGHGV
jgi:chromosome segregation ATPase